MVYPTPLIATVALRFLRQPPATSRMEDFRNAASIACKFIDECEAVASSHYYERNGLEVPSGSAPRIPFREALRAIVPRFKSLPRATERYRRFLRDWLTGDGGFKNQWVAADLEKSVEATLLEQQSRGLSAAAVEHFKPIFAQWHAAQVSAGHSVSGKASAAKRAAKKDDGNSAASAEPQRKNSKKRP